MDLFQVANWPLLLVCLGMIACAVIDWWKLKVPNYLTFPLILGGWLLGALHNFDIHPFGESGHGGFGAAFVGTFWGFALLFPVLAIGGVGEGDVKMQMGFASWIGAFFGFEGGALWIIFYAFCAGAIIGGILSAIMMLVRGDFQRYTQHTRRILMDLATVGSVSKIRENALERKPTWHKLPYGIPLCLGFVGYLFLAAHFGQPKTAEEEKSGQSTAVTASVFLVRGHDVGNSHTRSWTR